MVQILARQPDSETLIAHDNSHSFMKKKKKKKIKLIVES